MDIDKFKKYGLYASVSGIIGWEYFALVSSKYYGKNIARPSFFITKSGELIKMCFYKIGESIGVVYDKMFYVIENIREHLEKLFSKFGYYIKIFINDIKDTSVQIFYPLIELIKSPTELTNGFFNKLNELSPVNIKTFAQVSFLTIASVFGIEYALLKYEVYRQKTSPNYSFKYKPSCLLGSVSTKLQTQFTNTGKYFGNFILDCSKKVIDFGNFCVRTIENIPKFIKETFGNIYETTRRLLYPSFGILQSPLYFVKNYIGTIDGFTYQTTHFKNIVKYLPTQLTFFAIMFGIFLSYNHKYIKTVVSEKNYEISSFEVVKDIYDPSKISKFEMVSKICTPSE